MKKLIFISLLTLSACAEPGVYQKQNINSEQEQQDYAQCKYEAVKATGSSASGSVTEDTSTTIANDIATGVRQGEIFKLCLESKGYKRQ